MSKSADGKFYCSVPDCCGEAKTAWGMRRHFCLRHPHDWVIPDGEVRYLKCDNCGMQTSPLAWTKNGGHATTKLCRAGGERRQQHLRRAAATQAQRREFVISGDTLKRAESFKYLGHYGPYLCPVRSLITNS